MQSKKNVHVNFHCGVSATLIFCYKIARVALVSLINQPMGCKGGFNSTFSGEYFTAIYYKRKHETERQMIYILIDQQSLQLISQLK